MAKVIDIKSGEKTTWRDALTNHIEEWNKRYASVTVGNKHRIAKLEEADISVHNREVYAYYPRKELSLLYENTKIQVDEKTERNGDIKPIYKNHLMAWATDPRSKSYTSGVVFIPGKEAPANCLNTWRGFAVDPVQNDKLLERIIHHIKEIVCDGNNDLYNYFIKWVASGMQKPDEQIGSALVARGKKGVGKGIIGNFLMKIWANHGFYISSPKHLVGNFNSHLADACFLFSDEAFFAGDKKHEGVLKSLITEPFLTIEPKGLDVRQQKNYMKIFMATNEDFAVPATSDERRFCVFDVSEKHIGDKEYFIKLRNDCNNKEVQAAFLYAMLNTDINGWHSGEIPESKGLQDQRLHNFESHEQWLYSVLKNGGFEDDSKQYSDEEQAPVWFEKMSSKKLFSAYVKWCDQGKVSEFRRKNDTLFGRYMSSIFGQSKNHVGGQNIRGYVLGDLNEARFNFEEKHKVLFGDHDD